MVRTSQGGSVLRFIVIGVFLTALLIGGVYAVRQQLAQPTSSPTPETTQPGVNQPQPEEPQAREGQQPAPAPESPAPSTSQPSQPQPSPLLSGTGGSAPAALPQTGPVEVFSSLVALGFLSIASVSYVRSRRVDLSL